MFRQMNSIRYLGSKIRTLNHLLTIRCLSSYNYRKSDSQTKLERISKLSNIDIPNAQVKYVESSDITNKQLIDTNYGLRQFIKRTYLWTGGGICGSIGISILGATLFPEFASSLQPVVDGFILAIGSTFGIAYSDYAVHKDIIKNKFGSGIYRRQPQVEILYTKNSPKRQISYAGFMAGNGLMMMPMFVLYPHAVLPAFIASGSVFGGAVMYALNKKQGELEVWASGLYSGLTGMVVVSLLGLSSVYFQGPNMFGDFTHLISLYGGIPLFSGFVAYDTHKSIDKYMKGEPDHLGCSTELHMDFVNLFVRFTELISKFNSSK
jgi:FtsH-binding integral membrane protein